jgi:hypothetical protein
VSTMRNSHDSNERTPPLSEEKRKNLSRRKLLKGTASALIVAAGAEFKGMLSAWGQVEGIQKGGGTVPYRLPLGAMDHLDRNQYIHNMEIHAHLSGSSISGGEPLTTMWAKGKQRILPAGGGFVDISEGRNPTVINKGVIKGSLPSVAYNASLKKWVLMAAAAAPLTSASPEYPGGQYSPELREKAVNYKGLRGIRNYDLSNPEKPDLLQEFNTGETGNGTHMNFYDGGKYAYLDCGWDNQLRLENPQRPFSNGLMIVDMSDPARVKEVSRWWVPGQRLSEEEEYKKWVFAGDHSSWTSAHGAPVVPKRVEDGGNIGYGGFGAFGMFVFDFSDITKPKVLGRVSYELEAMGGIPFHTCYPVVAGAGNSRLRNLVIASAETVEADCRESYHTPYVVDVKDSRNPRIIGLFPRPVAPPNAPYSDFCFARGRFGSHNTQSWLAPGLMRPEIIAMSYFNAGIRIFDISDPTQPREVAWFVPPRDGNIDNYESWWRGTSESVFIEWDRNLIWLGTHEGTYCLSTPALGKPVLEPRKVEKWSIDHCNVGWDDQTAQSVYFGRSTSQMG